jgi:hypothetical protein
MFLELDLTFTGARIRRKLQKGSMSECQRELYLVYEMEKDVFCRPRGIFRSGQ